MIKIKLLLILFLLVGCCPSDLYHIYQGKCYCQRCDRVIYDGPINVYSGGFRWPAGEIKHCIYYDQEECDRIFKEKYPNGDPFK